MTGGAHSAKVPAWVLGGAVIVLACAAGGAAYAAGHGEAPTDRDAQQSREAASRSAAAPARREAYRSARRQAYAAGLLMGHRAGRRTGRRRGTASGRKEGERRAEQARERAAAAAAAAEAERQRQAQQQADPGCVDVGDGVCEQLGPGAGGGACPSGTVPNADGGVVCVPVQYTGRQTMRTGERA